MSAVLWLLAAQGALGAFDTLYYHEWRARLPALGRQAHPELRLHAARDFIYALLFGALPWVEWRGFWALALAALFAAEIAITLADFVVEDRVRMPLGGVYAGERATHAIMGLIYGAVLAYLAPTLREWLALPSGLVASATPVSGMLASALPALSAGVFLSGLRDLAVVLELPGSGWPWVRIRA